MTAVPAGFSEYSESFGTLSKPVLAIGTAGPPVVVLHELFGMTETIASFSRMIADAGFVVHVPILFGSVQAISGTLAKRARGAMSVCVMAQMRCLTADQSGPWAVWLRKFVTSVCTRVGAKGAGVIGLCLTGDFALAMAVNPLVKASVLSEPSLPFFRPHLLHVMPEELAAVKARINDPGDQLMLRGYRFETDCLCPQAKFDRLEKELGDGFEGITLPASKRLHSVFTEDLRDEAGDFRHDKVSDVIGFLRHNLHEET